LGGRLRGKHFDEVSKFRVDLGLGVDRASHSGPEVIAEAVAEAVDGDFESAFGESGGLSHFLVGASGGGAEDAEAELLVEVGLSGRLQLGSQRVVDLLEQLLCPGPVEELFGAELSTGVLEESLLRSCEVEGQQRLATPAFLGVGFFALVEEEVFEGAEEVGTKFAVLGERISEGALFDPALKEGLSEVLGILGAASGAAQEGVEGGPIASEKVIQGVERRVGGALGAENEGPLGVEKAGVTGPEGGVGRAH
jgi:hypothetical protein